MDPYLGSIYPWPINWAPENFMLCQGQLLNIVDYEALYSLIATTYGGDGTHTFALPNLTGRVPVGVSQNIPLGATGGSTSTTLSVAQIPTHNHTANAYSNNGSTAVPTNNLIANTVTDKDYITVAEAGATLIAMAGTAIGNTGNPAPASFSIVQPNTCLNFIICVQGMYPDRP